jgi:hypothetical protein
MLKRSPDRVWRCHPPKVHVSNWRLAARQARWRARQKRDVAICDVPVSHAVINMLIDLRWLQADESENREQIADAILRLLTDAARHYQK